MDTPDPAPAPGAVVEEIRDNPRNRDLQPVLIHIKFRISGERTPTARPISAKKGTTIINTGPNYSETPHTTVIARVSMHSTLPALFEELRSIMSSNAFDISHRLLRLAETPHRLTYTDVDDFESLRVLWNGFIKELPTTFIKSNDDLLDALDMMKARGWIDALVVTCRMNEPREPEEDGELEGEVQNNAREGRSGAAHKPIATASGRDDLEQWEAQGRSLYLSSPPRTTHNNRTTSISTADRAGDPGREASRSLVVQNQEKRQCSTEHDRRFLMPRGCSMDGLFNKYLAPGTTSGESQRSTTTISHSIIKNNKRKRLR